jgi:predicted Mrr-cat superfamily restriction endonuclease
MWGIHNDKPRFDFVEEGFVALGWRELGDLRRIGTDRDALKAALAAAYPDAKPRAIPAWAGVLLRFAFEMRAGDLVVHPDKRDRTVSVGRLAGDYRFEADELELRHRRDVEWLATGAPREMFSQSARYELGCTLTLFRLSRHEHEFRALVGGALPVR